ncbi:type VI secretion system-associated protein TagF [Mesorhizobium sp. B2-5-3]|uniref:type VI secretion system-associated protein TagF n=1 Tax=Mesorhizobium sp. B2-5-3 TaxID=2589927 RepID=UPI0011289877|nr:type VI secretion system-associated protein TagF [Mesorhizobium sp. B2-5-3]TPK32312.1 type VI secretion system-associated protein TagF [Mesorhizobium sp. B2-5-3]
MTTGFFGKIPSTGDFITWNLPRVLTDRWDRWMSIELRDRPDTGELNPRIWRFSVRAGIFGDQPNAGVWRMSEDRAGRRYPFAIVRLGPPPEATDRWFDEMARLISGCVDDFWPPSRLQQRIVELPPPGYGASPERIAFWTDDWEVRELAFADIYDLADNGLIAMRQASTPAEA